MRRSITALLAITALSGVGFAAVACGDGAAAVARSSAPSGSSVASANPSSAAPTIAPTPTRTDTGVGPGEDYAPDGDSVPAISNLSPLPKCTIGDMQTPLTDLRDWRLTLVDSTLAISQSYVPTDLVTTAAAGLDGGHLVRSVMIPDLAAMAKAADKAGFRLGILSTYRTWNDQNSTFWSWVGELGYSNALLSSARVGHSEHELGLAIDFEEEGGPFPWTYYDFSRDTVMGRWLKANAWQYGFVMSYPVGKTPQTCYGFEPWHYRFVGRADAAAIHSSGLTVREWLWQRQPNDDNAASTSPAANTSPAATASPTAAPSLAAPATAPAAPTPAPSAAMTLLPN